MAATITPVEALSELLIANLEYSEELIDDDQLTAINDTFIAVAGDAASDRLTEICVRERWSPEDMAACGRDQDATAALYARLVTS